MDVQQTPVAMTESRERESDVRLHGRWIVLGRGTWIAQVVLSLGIFVASFPVYLAQLRTLCLEPTAACSYWRLTSTQVKVLSEVGWSLDSYATFVIAITLVLGVLYLVLSTLIIWYRPDDCMALLVAFLLVSFVTSPAADIVSAARDPLWQVPNKGLISLWYALIVLVFSLFPSGRFVPRWTRWTLIVCLAALVPYAFFPRHTPQHDLGWLLVLAELTILPITQIYRYLRVSHPLERQQMKWVTFGFVVPATVYAGGIVLSVLFPVLYDLASPTGASYQLALTAIAIFLSFSFPLSLGVAVLRYRLWEIDVLINRTLVYGMLTVLVVGAYVLVVTSISTLFHTSRNIFVELFATSLVAFLFQPLRVRLQRMINRLMYGERDDPSAVLSRLGHRLEAALTPEMVLPTIVETIAGTLKLPYVAIALRQGDMFIAAASFGHSQNEPLVLPLVYNNETIAQLLIAQRAPHETFTSADLRLLEAIASQAGIAAHAVRLAADLQRSRERLVTTREEERRRLRRDLHDGLGPTLASMTLKLDAARNILIQNPSAVDPLLVELKSHTQATIVDIRRLVYDLRPPTLDELGLVSALREQIEQHSHPGGVRVVIEAPLALPPLSAAVEVAVYRVVLEAVTNVARHAQARTCYVRLQLSDALTVDVNDDGQGLPHHFQAGVGISSMRERAAELGGTCVIESNESGGTRILLRFPLTKE